MNRTLSQVSTLSSNSSSLLSHARSTGTSSFSRSNSFTQPRNPDSSYNIAKKRKIQQIQENNDMYILFEESLISEEFQKATTAEFFDSNNPVTFNAEQDQVKFPYLSLTTPLPGLIQWVRTETLPESPMLYTDVVPFLQPITGILVSNEEFCSKILESNDGIEFPALDQYVQKLTSKVRQYSDAHVKMRFTFVAVDFKKTIDKVQRKESQKSVPQLVDQAIIHLMYEHDIEVFRCTKLNELSEYLHSITRTLHTTIEKNCSVFSLVMKASRQKADENLEGKEKENFEMKQTWSAMLQMLPLLSKEKSSAFVNNPKYSCPKKVFDAMNDHSVPAKDRMSSLYEAFGKSKNGTVRQEKQLSKYIYGLMTIDEPDQTLSEET